MREALGRLALGRYGRIRGSGSLSFRGSVPFIGTMREHGLLLLSPIQSSRPCPTRLCFGAETRGFLLAANGLTSSSHWRGLLFCAFAPDQGNRI